MELRRNLISCSKNLQSFSYLIKEVYQKSNFFYVPNLRGTYHVGNRAGGTQAITDNEGCTLHLDGFNL